MDEGALSSIMTEAMVDTHSPEEPAFDKVPFYQFCMMNSAENISALSGLFARLFIKPLLLILVIVKPSCYVPPFLFLRKFESSLSFACKLALALNINSRRERSQSFGFAPIFIISTLTNSHTSALPPASMSFVSNTAYQRAPISSEFVLCANSSVLCHRLTLAPKEFESATVH